MSDYPKAPWWHFWNPWSGPLGGWTWEGLTWIIGWITDRWVETIITSMVLVAVIMVITAVKAVRGAIRTMDQ